MQLQHYSTRVMFECEPETINGLFFGFFNKLAYSKQILTTEMSIKKTDHHNTRNNIRRYGNMKQRLHHSTIEQSD